MNYMNMECGVCGEKSDYVFNSLVLNKYDVKYYLCPNCGFMQTEKPYWLKEAYKNSINDADTGYIRRNINLSKILLVIVTVFFDKTKKYLDYGSGYGMLPRIMRDYGIDFYWSDPLTQNLFCKYFEYTNQKIEAITCFECFEHFDNPINEIEKMLSISRNLIFSTVLIPPLSKVPSKSWWYYGFQHGQHISFYSIETLKFIAQKYNLYLLSNKANFHILTTKKISPLVFKIVYRISIGPFAGIFKKFTVRKTEADSLEINNKKMIEGMLN